MLPPYTQSQRKKKKKAIRVSFQRCHRCPVRACAAAGGSEKRRSVAASPGRRRTPTGGASAPGPPLSSKLQRLPTGSAGGTQGRDPPYAASLFQIASLRLEADPCGGERTPFSVGLQNPSYAERHGRPRRRSPHAPVTLRSTLVLPAATPHPALPHGQRHYSNPRPRRRLCTPLASRLALPAGDPCTGDADRPASRRQSRPSSWRHGAPAGLTPQRSEGRATMGPPARGEAEGWPETAPGQGPRLEPPSPGFRCRPKAAAHCAPAAAGSPKSELPGQVLGLAPLSPVSCCTCGSLGAVVPLTGRRAASGQRPSQGNTLSLTCEPCRHSPATRRTRNAARLSSKRGNRPRETAVAARGVPASECQRREAGTGWQLRERGGRGDASR